ncbi:FAD-dependent oxidoreductase [Pinirhizobacter sp.]|jgi:FAD/FMN-containing dehydrogenase|uniref:FAD-dependent oxidoreductase n=1 Tax=Pinirhizobacter sp. TaxID=2950432 RepID=UPI002F418CC8
MDRRTLLKTALVLPLWPLATKVDAFVTGGGRWLKPGARGWPTDADWDALNSQVGGRLSIPKNPLLDPVTREEALAHIGNQFYVGDQPGLTQTGAYYRAWTSTPSARVLAAESAQDIATAVTWARRHRVRLVIRGGGHSYLGASNAPDSLLIWTRRMNAVQMADAFVPQGARAGFATQPAVHVGAGAMWIDAYHAVTTVGGRYVQGGGCTTVGCAGFTNGGGFGSLSKGFGTGASNLLEAEVVTADGNIRVVNAFQDPDLFWALKGGGGGSFGVITRLTFRTHELPELIGGVRGTLKADSDETYQALVAQLLRHFRDHLCNTHWGESIEFHGDGHLDLSMMFQGLGEDEAKAAWQPLLDWVAARPSYTWVKPFWLKAMPARHFWDLGFYQKLGLNFAVPDDRPGTPAYHMMWAGDREQVGTYLHAYTSAWLPSELLQGNKVETLATAIVEASRELGFALHFNKGLYGASAQTLAQARDTAMNPEVLNAFALAIIANGGPPVFEGLPGVHRDEAKAQRGAEATQKSYARLTQVAPGAGAYFSESDFFQKDYKKAYWGTNVPRLAAVKRKYDPEGIFMVRNGIA